MLKMILFLITIPLQEIITISAQSKAQDWLVSLVKALSGPVAKKEKEKIQPCPAARCYEVKTIISDMKYCFIQSKRASLTGFRGRMASERARKLLFCYFFLKRAALNANLGRVESVEVF
jgi:hypothetical protein